MSELVYKIKTQAPSNIAFVKYWGKLEDQKPINPSLSMTLTDAKTLTQLEMYNSESDQFDVVVYLNESFNESFSRRIRKYISELIIDYPVLASKKYIIKTQNSFPHSSGIASSASGFAALALGLWSFLAQELRNNKIGELEDVSSLARRGSGSAARSFDGPYISWGDQSLTEATREDSHGDLSICDTIVLVEKGQKKISSSEGHKLMDDHHFKLPRIEKAKERFELSRKCLTQNNWSLLGELIEQEALELHALMMTSSKSFWLISPKTLEIMNWIREYRSRGLKVPVYFTLDAGANVHCLYPSKYAQSFQEDFANAFSKFETIHDKQGSGASIIESYDIV